MSPSSPRSINLDEGKGRNECNNNVSEINNANNTFNDNKNESSNDEN